MGGLGILFVVGLYIALSFVAVVNAGSIKAKAIVLLMALLIPTADAIYGRYQLKQMCAAEGGLKVYRVAQGVKGFMASTASKLWIESYGYEFSEGERMKGNFYRISKQNNQFITEENVTPRSRYQLKFIKSRNKEKYTIDKVVVQDMQGEVLAEDIQISYWGGWAERFLASFSGAGGTTVAACENFRRDIYKQIVLKTLKQSNNKEQE